MVITHLNLSHEPHSTLIGHQLNRNLTLRLQLFQMGNKTKKTTHSRSGILKAKTVEDKYQSLHHGPNSKVFNGLTEEIKEYVNAIAPTSIELATRNRIYRQLNEQLKMLWPDAEARCFGSFATALFLPESDMDVCILSATTNHRYKNSEKITELANHLQSCGLYYDVVAVIETRVPIIKLGDKESVEIYIMFAMVVSVDIPQLVWSMHF
ncbi:unnamed protein product [Ambrosiozyma monospora]|uniref:Unnamed protein product n=1 Tax=Ambrosiozyma monospora TaxID=43982 RepID=A0ACB5T9P3_AMBMO|nr:unnamed protein product [Ambrosiozyma monospora]